MNENLEMSQKPEESDDLILDESILIDSSEEIKLSFKDKLIRFLKNPVESIKSYLKDKQSNQDDESINSEIAQDDSKEPEKEIIQSEKKKGFPQVLSLGIASNSFNGLPEVRSLKLSNSITRNYLTEGERKRRDHLEKTRHLEHQRAMQKASMPSSRVVGGKRLSMETPSLLSGGLNNYAQFSRSKYWHSSTLLSRFNTDDFTKLDIDELAELLTELSPEVSAALWYYLLCCNSGFEIQVYKPGTKDVFEKAQEYLNSCTSILGKYHGTLNTFFDKTFMCIFMRGSFLYESVLDENGRDFVDIASPDTKTLSFLRKDDEKRGQIWDFGQLQEGKFVSLADEPSIAYVPLHPLPGKIEGRPMISPSFFVSIFLMSVLRDLKRVIQQQGYMRLDLSVELEKLRDSMPEGADQDPMLFKEWSDQVIDSIIEFYSQLEPDDAFVHSDAVSVNNPVGTANMNSLSAMDALFKVLERMAVRALKTLPSFLGLQESSSQGAENRKFEFYQKGNESIQRMVESGFGGQCEYILQAQGFLADVEIKFAQMRASEELRDLQIAFLKATIGGFYFDRGWFNQNESAKFATGKDKADQQTPRTSAGNSPQGNGIQTLQPEGSVNRFEQLSKYLRNPSENDLNQAFNLWMEHAPEEAKGLIQALPFSNSDE